MTSVSGASSYAASVGSSNASSHHRLKNKLPEDGINGDGDLEVGRGGSNLEQGVLGVLFTLSKENSETRVVIRWALLKIVLDAWQMLTVVVQPSQGWDIDSESTLWRAVGVLNFTWLRDLGYGAYLAVLYTMVAALGLNVVLCVWVAWCFKEQKFPVVWPVVVLRAFSSVFFQAFDVTALNLLQLGFSCRFTGPAKPHLHMDYFPEKSCFSMPHLAHAVVSAMSLLLFIAIALLLNMAEVEVNPTSRRPLALGHSGAEVTAFAIKALITLVNVFLGWRRVDAVAYLILSLALAWQYLRWSPHLVVWVNYLKAGMAAAVVYASAVLCLLVFNPGVKATDLTAVADWSHAMTITLAAGLVPAFGAGALLSWACCRWKLKVVLRAFAEAAPDTPLHDVYPFMSERDVEIVARSCRVWRSRKHLDTAAVNAAHQVLKAGLAMFPTSAFMALVHANFMVDVLGVTQAGSRQVEAARKLSPSLMCRFMIFTRTQQATQRAAGSHANGGGGASMDLLGYVEFQRKQRMVVRLHREALQAMGGFWKCLDSSNVSFTTLSKALSKIESSVSQAQAVYRVVLEMYGSSPRLVRLYGKFLERIKNDPWGAAMYYAEAERLEELKDADAAGGPLLPDGTPLGRMDELATAVLVISAEGNVQMANKQSYAMLGYKRGMLDGKAFSSIMAPQYAPRMASLLAALVGALDGVAQGPPAAALQKASAVAESVRLTSGTTNSDSLAGVVLDTDIGVAETCALVVNRERLALPVTVTVSRATGVGEDSTFIVVIEPLQPQRNAASLWVSPTGVVTACDPAFCAHLGFQPSDVIGTFLGRVLALDASSPDAASAAAAAAAQVAAAAAAEVTVRKGRAGTKASRRAGPPSLLAILMAHSIGVDGRGHPEDIPPLSCLVAHKFESTPMACTVSLPDDGTITDLPIHEVRIQLPGTHLLLVANRKGAIRYASNPIANALLERGGSQQLGAARRMSAFGSFAGAGLVAGAGAFPSGGEGLDVVGAAAACGRGPLALLEALYNFSLHDFLPPMCKAQHIKLLKDANPPSQHSRAMWSCRRVDVLPEVQHTGATGLRPLGPTLELRGVRGSPLYARVAVASRDLGGETLHAVRLDWSSQESALTERRLQLKMSPDGSIAEVSNGSPAGLFSFEPSQLSGRLLWDVVEEMGDDAGWQSNSSAGLAYSALLNRATSQPGKSWRVFVRAPAPAGSSTTKGGTTSGPPSRGPGAGPVAVASPAFMQVHLISYERQGRQSGGIDGGQQLVVDLWPLDAVTGVLELDAEGRVRSVVEGATRPVGLLFGLPAAALVGDTLGRLVTLPPGRDAASLLSLHGIAKKSNLKTTGKDQGVAVKVGPVHVLPGRHADGRPLALEVQVVGRPEPGQPLTCLIRCHPEPLTAAPGGTPPPLALTPVGRADGAAALEDDTASPFKHSASSALRVQPSGIRLSFRSRFGADDPNGTRDGSGAAGSPRFTPPPLAMMSSQGNDTKPAMRSEPSATAASGRVRRGGSSINPALSSVLAGLLKASASGSIALAATSPGDGRLQRQGSILGTGDGPLDAAAPGSISGSRIPKEIAVVTAQDLLDCGMIGALDLPGSVDARELLGDTANIEHCSDDGGGGRSDVSSDHDLLLPAEAPTTAGKGRISTWVTSDGAYYQNTAAKSPGGSFSKADEADGGLDRTRSILVAPSKPLPPMAADTSVRGGVSKNVAGAGGNEPNRPGSEDDAASEGGYSASSSQSGGGVEFRRGKRFRKLVKLMDSTEAQHVVRRLRFHALLILAILAVVRTAFFAASMTSIQTKREAMLDLAIAGRAQLYMQRALFNMRAIDRIYSNNTLPSLYTIADLPDFANGMLADVESVSLTLIKIAKDYSNKAGDRITQLFYYQPLSVWMSRADDGTDVYKNVTVWEGMQKFYTSCKQIYQVYTDTSVTADPNVPVSPPADLAASPAALFLLNSGPLLARTIIRRVITELLEEAVVGAKAASDLQVAFLIVEGVVITSIAALYMGFLLRAVAVQRFKLFGTFLYVPVGLTRALATQETALDEDEEEEEDDGDADDNAPAGGKVSGDGTEDGYQAAVAADRSVTRKRSTAFDTKPGARVSAGGGFEVASDGQPDQPDGRRASASGKRAPGRRRSSRIGFDTASKPERPREMSASFRAGPRARTGCWGTVVDRLGRLLGRRGPGVSPTLSINGSAPAVDAAAAADGASKKRQLKYDSYDTTVMLTPFILWSSIVIVVYALAVMDMKSVIGAVAVHGVVNIHAARTYRGVVYAQELVSETDPARLAQRRAGLLEAVKLAKDAFFTMKLGSEAVLALGSQTEVFPRVEQGIAYSTPAITRILFDTRDCLRLQQHLPCPGTMYRYHQVTHGGLDAMVQTFFEVLTGMAVNQSATPPGSGDEGWDFAYNVGTKDLAGGNIKLSEAHYDFIVSRFEELLILHVILFIMIWVVICIFVFVLLNPLLKRIAKEKRRIAELMSQLPLELDVSGLMARALGEAAAKGASAATAGKPASPGSGGEGGAPAAPANENAKNYWKTVLSASSQRVKSSKSFGGASVTVPSAV